jgi:penicillin G amidase
MDRTITVAGSRGPVTVRRDSWGVAHVEATCEADAWFGQGFVAAEDRLWQMEFDRRSALGTWAEVAGPSAVGADLLARRLNLRHAALLDLDAMSEGTRNMFEAYALGVNAFIASGLPLPPEFGITGTSPAQWEAWHSVANFRIRHVHMGVWQQKLAQAILLRRIGPEAYARLDLRSPHGTATILPPGVDGAVGNLLARGAADLADAFSSLAPVISLDGGSNSWVVHGSRVTTGKPVACNDSHRRLDVPTVYWQVHLACPEFQVAGATFPGVPGLPHFGHNGSVTWSITHGCADTQDLYIEEFDPARPGWYRTPDGWAEASHASGTIHVAGAPDVPVETWRTRHGPIVHGDPRTGWAISFRWIATDGPTRQAFEPFRPMLHATTVAELFATQADWVDPVNNMLAADIHGSIGYQARGVLVDRAPGPDTVLPGNEAFRQFPVPGWTDAYAWRGRVPYDRNPRSINPPEGYVATANQQIVDGDDPYIADSFSPPWRAERLVELLANDRVFTLEEIAGWQADVTSVSARAWGVLIGRLGHLEGDAGRARDMLAGFDGYLRPERPEALLYGHVRRALARHLFAPVVGEATWEWLVRDPLPIGTGLVSRWFVTVQAALMRRAGLAVRPDIHPRAGRDADAIAAADAWWEAAAAVAIPAALADGWAATVRSAGPDPSAWRWDARHRTNAAHPLGVRFPQLRGTLDPPVAPLGGDGDTLQAASYAWAEGPDFDITGLSVFRHVVALDDPTQATNVIPGGVSGVPGGRHAHDQLERWRVHRRVPAPFASADVAVATEAVLHLIPGARAAG